MLSRSHLIPYLSLHRFFDRAFGLARLSTLCFALAMWLGLPTAQAAPVPLCTWPTDNLQVRGDVTICPGSYTLTDVAGDGLIKIVSSGVRVHLAGVSINGRGDGYGIVAKGVSNVTIDGFNSGSLQGFRVAVLLKDGDRHTVRNLNLSNNRKRTIYNSVNDFLQVWPDWSGQLAADQIGNGVVLDGVSNTTISNNTMRHQQNGIGLFNSDGNRLEGNNCSDNQGWGIHLHRSSRNTVVGNVADNNHLEASPWCVTHQEAGCDTAAILVIKGSNDNLVQNNSLRNSGDGVFAAAQENATHWGSDRNRYIGNDVSHAKHIGIESTFSDANELRDNLIHGCGRYGIWLGYSRNASITGNTITGNQLAGIANESTELITVQGNTIDGNGNGIQLWRGSFPYLDQDSRDYVIHGNSIADNTAYGLSLADTHAINVRFNTIADNNAGNFFFATEQESNIEGPITITDNNILGLDVPYNVLTSCCEVDCGVCDGEVGCCDSIPGCSYYFCSNQCHPTGTSNCDAGCSDQCGAKRGVELGGDLSSLFGADAAEWLQSPLGKANPDDSSGTGCRDHDGDVAACDATPGCAYYLCSDRCHPTGTSNCDAGCTEDCGGGEGCRDHDGDVAACDAAAGCSYYLCSNQCHPTGTSNCDAGCGGDCGGDFCDWAAIVDLSNNWWGTTDLGLIGSKLCSDFPFLPIRIAPVP